MARVSQRNEPRSKVKARARAASATRGIDPDIEFGNSHPNHAGAALATAQEAPTTTMVADLARSNGKHPLDIGLTPSSDPRALQGRIDRLGPAEIRGWAWDPQTPDKRIRLELFEDESRLLDVVADNHRPDLFQLGCGDGCHGFSIRLDSGLLLEGRHVLGLRCADTGSEIPGSPIVLEIQRPEVGNHPTRVAIPPHEPTPASRVHISSVSHNETPGLTRRTGGQGDALISDVASLPEPADSPATLWSNSYEPGVDGHVRHTVSCADHARFRVMKRFGTQGVTALVLSVSDRVQETRTRPSRFFTDSMAAVWLSREDVQRRFQRLEDEVCQYGFLVWYLCVRPIEEGLALSCEPTGPVLAAMAEEVVAEERESGASCTVLMLAAYCYVATFDGSDVLAPRQCEPKDIVAWFFREGAYHLRVSHAIPRNIRASLAAFRSNGLSPILEWAAHRMLALGPANVVNGVEPEGILEWLDALDHEPAAACWRDLSRESRILGGQPRFDDPPAPFIPAVCGRLRDVVRNKADLLVIDGHPEYMCIGGNGGRLLLRDEWYPAEPTFVWSRSPISTVLFCIAVGPVEWLRIGLTFDRAPLSDRGMRVILNHNTLWSGTIADASTGELILACTSRCLARDAPNLLQIEVDSAFVPAEQMPSSDRRRLGIGLKRLWVQRAEGSI